MTRSEALPVAIQRPSGLKATPRKPLATFAMGEDLSASDHVADDQVPFQGWLVGLERPRHRGDPRAVGAERHAVDRLPRIRRKVRRSRWHWRSA